MRERALGRGGAGRGLLVLVAALLLPLAAVLPTPRAGEAQSTGQDTLWAVSKTSIGVCQSPTSPAALSGCFASAATQMADGSNFNRSVATDGVNVYVSGIASSPGYSCPIADLGANCTEIMTGGWGSSGVVQLAAADGYLWIGQNNGMIYKCPNNLPFVSQSSAPAQCVALDNAGHRSVGSLLLANGRLYVGLDDYGVTQSKQGILWNCDPDTVNACSNFDYYGETQAYTMAYGGGWLWAGLESGIVWRCDPDTANSCANWEKAGGSIYSLSYNGQGTLYAAVAGSNGVIWSCPTATANSCSNLVTGVYGWSVAAGPDGVFSSVDTSDNAQVLRYGTSPYTAYALGSNPELLYFPAEGQVGVGGAKVEVGAVSLPAKLDRRCRSGGGGPRVVVTVRGPRGMTRSQQVGLCTLRGGATTVKTFSLLDPGGYVVTARSKKGAYVGHEKLTVEPGATTTMRVLLAPRKADG